MKFENIKVGDTVFTEKQVMYGWNSAKTFYTLEKVIRTTKTQFVVESGDRYKKEGNKIGDRYTKACLKGDNIGYFRDEIVTEDQSPQMIEFKQKLIAETKFNSIAEKINISKNSEFSLSEINNMILKLEYVQSLIETKNEQ